MTGATRYPCPLNCGWHHDEPEPADISGLTDDSVDEIALAAMTRQARRIELTLRAHFATHGWDQWAPALIKAQNDHTQIRAGLEAMFTRWFLNAHAGLTLRDAMTGIAADIRSILDQPAAGSWTPES